MKAPCLGSVEKLCVVCGAAFRTFPSHAARHICCSVACANIRRAQLAPKRAPRVSTVSVKVRAAKLRAVAARTAKYAHRFPRIGDTNRHQRIRRLVRLAIKAGSLVRPETCQDCGEPHDYIDAHHEDYSKPLDVVWLCKSCHKLRHYRAAPSVEAKAS